ncbi:MAG: hypothetical protein CVT60_06495 [Actinobacteria bacterium HGW-Actinobacteria-10]|nr:MAG: hypothetical protein CVT60_06495 [Actinobacteria bacterium HGW-Actinobacteria-10]
MKRGPFVKAFAVVGTALVIVPVAAVIASAIPLMTQSGSAFDWMTPAEYAPIALVGGVLLLGCALMARDRMGLVITGNALSFGVLIAGLVVARVTGLATGQREAEGLVWALVAASIAIYGIGLLVLIAAGMLLTRDLFHAPTSER